MQSVTSNAVDWMFSVNSYLSSADTREVNDVPSDFMEDRKRGNGMYINFKACADVGNPFSNPVVYCLVITFVPWQDSSGGYPTQIAFSGSAYYLTPKIRTGIDSNNWSGWVDL